MPSQRTVRRALKKDVQRAPKNFQKNSEKASNIFPDNAEKQRVTRKNPEIYWKQ